jgi:hypothetical protein
MADETRQNLAVNTYTYFETLPPLIEPDLSILQLFHDHFFKSKKTFKVHVESTESVSEISGSTVLNLFLIEDTRLSVQKINRMFSQGWISFK